MSDSSPPPDTSVTPPPDSSSSSPPPPDTTVTSPPPDSSTITPPPPASSTVTAPPPSSTVTPPPPDSSTLTPPPTSSDASPPPPTITPLPSLLSPPPAPSAPPPTASVTPPPPPTDTTASPPPSTVTSPPPSSTVVSPPPPSTVVSPPPPSATPSTPAPPPTSTTASPPPPITPPPPGTLPSPPPVTPPPPGTLPSPPPPPASLLSPPPPSSTNSSTPTPTTPSTTPSPPGGSTPLAPPPPPTYSSPSPPPGGLTPGAAAAVGVVVAAFVLAFIGLFVCYTRKRRRPNMEGYQQGYPNGFGMPNSAQFSPQQMSGEAPFLMSSPSRAMSGNHSRGPNGSGRYSSGPYNSGGPNYTNSKNYSAGSQGSKITDLNVGSSQLSFGYDELYEITGGFAKDNILGEGGFGCVYKGKLADGKEVAVKELKGGGGQGEREFQAEVEIISRVHHRHLVSLVGFCIADNHRLLVYDFVSNGTLHYHIHGKRGSCMEWSTRVRVAAGSARGLAYLHEDCHPKVIHRDIKSANILIDDHFEAQVADFGLARPTDTNATHVSTRVMGTFGYLAPEYASTGKLTEKSDVFSFGVVLLELTTGRKPVDGNRPVGEESLVEWARPLLNQALESEDHDFKELVDPNLGTNYKEVEMFRMIETAAACIRHSASRRPKMSQVVRVLDSLTDEVDISNGVQPGKSQMFNVANTADIRLFQKMAFGSQEFSSEYSHTRGESNLSSRNF